MTALRTETLVLPNHVIIRRGEEINEVCIKNVRIQTIKVGSVVIGDTSCFAVRAKMEYCHCEEKDYYLCGNLFSKILVKGILQARI